MSETITIEAPGAQVDIDLANGGRLVSWRIGELDLLVAQQPDHHEFAWGSFIMAPWAGRIRRGRFTFDGVEHQLPRNFGEHAIHGFVATVAWDIIEQTANRVTMSHDLSPHWPFGGRVIQSVALTEGALAQTITVEAGERALPVSVGWHPWFRRQLATGGPIELDIDLSHARMYVRDADYIPTGRTLPAPPGPWDDCFTDVGAVALHWPGALRLTAEHDCSSLVVYDPDDAVCVEPQSAPPDAINWDPHSVRLEPGGHLEHHVIWRWVKD